MIEVTLPGSQHLRLAHLVMDYNGTLAMDGCLLQGVRPRLEQLAGHLQLHVVTADTFGIARDQLQDLNCQLSILGARKQSGAKLAYVRELGRRQVASIGNGRNDHLMLRASALGIAVIQGEGAAVETCRAADLLVPDILAALDLLLYPQRLVASLRS
jgi:soluble P-type ATPase